MNKFPKGGKMTSILITSAIVVGVFLLILLAGYIKAPPNKALIISGVRKVPRVLIGRAGIRIPFLERKDELLLESISVDVKTEEMIPTKDCIKVSVDAVANIQVNYDKTQPEIGIAGIEKASKNFLNRDAEYIGNFVRETLEGNLREIIGKITIRTLVEERQEVVNQVADNVIPDLDRMGINLVSFNIQNFKDTEDIIESLGIENVSRIKKDASIAKANADRDVAIAQAEANKNANDARILAELEIQKKNQELEIKKAELKKEADVKIATADAAYKIQEQEERKKVEISTQNAEIAKAELEKDLQIKQVLIQEQKLEAEIKKQAEATKYADIQEADAELYRRVKDAEAARIEEQERAKGIEAVGKAEADAIRLKGLAEAESIDKKAEAMKKFEKAAIAEMFINVLPEMAEAIAKPIAAIDKVSIIGGDSNGVANLSDNVPQVLAKTIQSVKETTGFDLTEVLKANTLEAKTTYNVNLEGANEVIEGANKVIEQTNKAVEGANKVVEGANKAVEGVNESLSKKE